MSKKVHLIFLSTWIHGSDTPKSFDPRKDRSVLKYFCLASSHFASILSICKRLKNRPDCYVLVKRQKVFATNSNCPDNLRNLACFEEVGGSLWIIKSFYRNSETVGQQCRGRTGTLKSDITVSCLCQQSQKPIKRNNLFSKILGFNLMWKVHSHFFIRFLERKAMGICKLTTFFIFDQTGWGHECLLWYWALSFGGTMQ